uniref:Pancreatic trypsin inhibitor n=1 Tax=Rhipicephalus zambeziensis TaxID=60191 RepID=A0A224YCS3_9ACAR
MKFFEHVSLVCILAYFTFVDGKGRGGCSLKPIPGNCTLKVTRWYYNKDNDTCNVIWLGACARNFNNYSSCKDCLRRCHLNKGKKRKNMEQNNALRHTRERNRCVMKA